jgi:hypothetical protein
MRYLSRLYAASIWHPDAIPPWEMKYRAEKRILWPIIDLLYIWIGVVAGAFGAPSITTVFGVGTSRTLCFTFAFISLLCLIGVAFPRLWQMEAVAKVILVGAHAALIGSLFSAAFGLDSLTRLYLVGFVAVSATHILYRLHILRLERLEREAPEPEDAE